jgi:hypothetical protein
VRGPSSLKRHQRPWLFSARRFFASCVRFFAAAIDAFLAIALRCSGVSLFALTFPPIRPSVAGVIGIVAERIAQLANSHAQAAIKINKRRVLPDASLNFFPRHDLAGILHQDYEQAKWLVLQLDAPALFQQFTRRGIHFKEAKLIGRGG